MCPLFAFGFESPTTMLILGALAVLLFGERLPEVARPFGKGLMEVRKGMRGIKQEIESAVSSATSIDPAPRYQEPENREEATAPKYEPPQEPHKSPE
jgi:sec-independent protein translocase protein TatA